MDKQEAYRIVYEDLHDIALLRGEDIDTRQADFWWLRGMFDVMERIANGVSCKTRCDYQNEVHANLEASRLKYEHMPVPELVEHEVYVENTRESLDADNATF